jgi:hypothetical protein
LILRVCIRYRQASPTGICHPLTIASIGTVLSISPMRVPDVWRLTPV